MALRGLKTGISNRFLGKWNASCKSWNRLCKAGPRVRARGWATLGIHPLSWLLSNNRLERVHFVSALFTSSNQLLLSNQVPLLSLSVAHPFAFPLGPALHNVSNIAILQGSDCVILLGFIYNTSVVCEAQIAIANWHRMLKIINKWFKTNNGFCVVSWIYV